MLICEIGNAHFGDFKRAKEMIRQAHNSGADLIKGQAFRPKDISGSMPKAFYEQCAFTEDQYLELMQYARDIGNDLFYSVFSSGFERLTAAQSWHKVAGVQTKAGLATFGKDRPNYLISVPTSWDHAIPRYRHAEVLHVSEYNTVDAQLWHIQELSNRVGRPVGYSDHTYGISNCLAAYKMWGAHIIEKHFCLVKEEAFMGKVFRDTSHGITSRELERLAKELSK